MLGLKEVETIHGRIEDKKVLQCWAGRFDIVISRAFSDLPTLLALSFPFLKKKGILLTMKGKGDGEEIGRFSHIEGIRYRLKKTVSLLLPFSPFKRTILLFEKG